jgi:serine/threonine-protein kinase
LTQSGVLLGSPNYMAPEQARCQQQEIGPATDIYALGVILYELLTGRPPFRGETPVDTLQQVVSVEPVPPRRLQPKVPRDLETICLKCLEKVPRQRYGSARELEEDLRRFLAGEPIRARPAGPLEQLVKWVRRSPLRAALWAVSLAIGLSGAAGLVWFSRDRAHRKEEMSRAVEEAVRLSSLSETLTGISNDNSIQEQLQAALGRVETLFERGDGDAHQARLIQQVREKLQQQKKDRALVVALEEIRLRQAEVDVDDFDRVRADGEYARAFQDHGIDVDSLEPAQAAERIRAQAIRTELVAALDDWALLRRVTRKKSPEAWRRLLEIARLADPDPWRDPLRRALAESDKQTLAKLAEQKEVATLSAPTLILFGNTLAGLGDFRGAVQLLQQAQQRYPSDFWINFHLASFHLKTRRPNVAEAVRFATAALALRSQSAGAHLKLGVALAEQYSWEEAIDSYERALQLSPRYTSAHNNIGVAYYRQGQYDQAISAYRKAIDSNPEHPEPHYNLGLALLKVGQRVQAIAAFREAVGRDKDMAKAHLELGAALVGEGQIDEAIASLLEARRGGADPARVHNNLGHAYHRKQQPDLALVEIREAIRLRPNYKEAHFNLAVALAQKGQVDEAIAQYRQVISGDRYHAGAHNNLGRLLFQTGQVDEAIVEFREAIRLDRKSPLPHANLAIALQRQGQLDQAIAEDREAIRLDPTIVRFYIHLGRMLIVKGDLNEAITCYRKALELEPAGVAPRLGLGWALRAQDRFDEALEALRHQRERISSSDPLLPQLEQMIRETESMRELAPRLALVLKGEAQPTDAAERVALARLCQASRQRNRAAARFFAEAFAERPELALDLEAAHRYNAATAAARTGCGESQDARELDDQERARWRKQALDWLRADLVLRVKQLKSGGSAASAAAGKLAVWQADPDLAGVRDKEGLAKLPAEEREQWQKLWAEVETLQAGARGK